MDITARKKAYPPMRNPPAQPQKPSETPYEVGEHFGCCSRHMQCLEVKDCVRKGIILDYNTNCALYKRMKGGDYL